MKIEAGSTSCFSIGGHVEWPHERSEDCCLYGENDVYRSCVCLQGQTSVLKRKQHIVLLQIYSLHSTRGAIQHGRHPKM